MLIRVLLITLIAAALPANAAEVIVNGSFETPVLSSPNSLQSYPTIPGWSPAGSATSIFVVRGNGGVAADWPTTGQSGDQFADFGNAPGTGIQQTVSIPASFLNPILSWFDATLGITPGGVFEFSTYTVSFKDSLDGIVASANYGTNTEVWTQRSLALPAVLLPGNYTLTFQPTSGVGQKDTLLDQVSLVPEPSLAFLIAITLPFLVRRRRA